MQNERIESATSMYAVLSCHHAFLLMFLFIYVTNNTVLVYEEFQPLEKFAICVVTVRCYLFHFKTTQLKTRQLSNLLTIYPNSKL